MFSYTKVLPLALLLSIPALAMEERSNALVPSSQEQQHQAMVASAEIVSADAATRNPLLDTLVTRDQFKGSVARVNDIDTQIAALQEQRTTALKEKREAGQRLDQKDGEKREKMVGLKALLETIEAELKTKQTAKATELERLKQQFDADQNPLATQLAALASTFETKLKETTEQFDKELAEIAARKEAKTAELAHTKATREEIFSDFQKAVPAKAEAVPAQKPGLLGLGFLGL